MSRFTGGWIKVHRSLAEKDIVDNPFLFSLWIYLLLIANYKSSQIIWKGKQRILERGQLLFKFREFSDKWGCSTKTIHKWLHYLQETTRITIEAETHGTIVTICNYTEYQVIEDTGVIPSKHEVNTEETPSKHEVNNSEEGKKERKVRKKENTIVGIRMNYPQEFESLWTEYGKRGDKKAAFQVYQKLDLASEDKETLIRSVRNYVVQNPEVKYRKHLNRFLVCDWREFLQIDIQEINDPFAFLKRGEAV